MPVIALCMFVLGVKDINRKISKSVSSQSNLPPRCFKGFVRILFTHLIRVFKMFISNLFGKCIRLFTPFLRVDLFSLFLN